MSLPSVTELIPVLQVAIGPVILISGVGLLLLSMTNRFGRAADRARSLYRNLPGEREPERARTRAQLHILWTRADLIRKSITAAVISVLLAALLIITLFFEVLLGLNAGWLILLLFAGCMLSLIVSLVLFLQDVNRSLLALKLELRDVLKDHPETEEARRHGRFE